MKTLAPGFRASPTFDAIRSAFEPSTSYQTVEDELQLHPAILREATHEEDLLRLPRRQAHNVQAYRSSIRLDKLVLLDL